MKLHEKIADIYMVIGMVCVLIDLISLNGPYIKTLVFAILAMIGWMGSAIFSVFGYRITREPG